MTTLEKLSRQLNVTPIPHTAYEVMSEAKAEIERLEKENMLFKSALIVIRDVCERQGEDHSFKGANIATEALSE